MHCTDHLAKASLERKMEMDTRPPIECQEGQCTALPEEDQQRDNLTTGD